MFASAVAALRCPHGEASLTLRDRSLVCPVGHRFDLARQGYANLLTGPAPAAADTASMVAARVAFQAAGHHRAISQALCAAVANAGIEPPRTIVDVGAGTGVHLAEVVQTSAAQAGLAIDISKRAAQRASRVHERVGAIVADVWQPLPVRDGAADVLLNVFAPRVPAEFARILAPGGVLVVVTPDPEHMSPLVSQLGLLAVGADKTRRLDTDLAPVGPLRTRRPVRQALRLRHDDIINAVMMGPNAHHTDLNELQAHVAQWTEPVDVALAVTVSTYHRPL